MALDEDAAIGSTAAVVLKLGSNDVALLVGTTDPDGDTDPWLAAGIRYWVLGIGDWVF